MEQINQDLINIARNLQAFEDFCTSMLSKTLDSSSNSLYGHYFIVYNGKVLETPFISDIIAYAALETAEKQEGIKIDWHSIMVLPLPFPKSRVKK